MMDCPENKLRFTSITRRLGDHGGKVQPEVNCQRLYNYARFLTFDTLRYKLPELALMRSVMFGFLLLVRSDKKKLAALFIMLIIIIII